MCRLHSVLNTPQFGFILGASGSGKEFGVGSILREYWPTQIFVSGDWCREHQTQHAEQGILVTDGSITDAGIEHYLRRKDEAKGQLMHFLFDAPRTLEQAQAFVRLFYEWGCESMEDIHTIDLRTEPKTAWDRILDRAIRKRRTDDQDPNVIARRLGFYFGEQAPEWTPQNLIYLPKGGVLNEVVPWLQQNTTYHLLPGDEDLETSVRNRVLKEFGPAIFGQIQKKVA